MEGWTEAESREMLQKILDVVGDITNKSYKYVESAMDWDSLGIINKSGEDCKLMFQHLINKVRKYRTMFEVVTDAIDILDQDGLKVDSKQYPDYPKKPLNAYSLYVKKRTKKFPGLSFAEKSAKFSQEWKELPEEKKEVYRQKYLKNKEKYEEEMQTFVQNHPEVKIPTIEKKPTKATKTAKITKPQVPVPSKLYQEAKLAKVLKKNPEMTNAEAVKKCQTRYHGLSDKRKLVWIKRAQEAMQTYQEDCVTYSNKHPDFKPSEFHLTKEEKKILDDSYGKPIPPPKNLYLYFIEVNKDKLSNVPFADRSKYQSNIYRNIAEEELRDLTQNYLKVIQDYIDQYHAFYSNIPEEEKPKHETPDYALKGYKAALKAEALKEKKKNNKADGTALKRPETGSPEGTQLKRPLETGSPKGTPLKRPLETGSPKGTPLKRPLEKGLPEGSPLKRPLETGSPEVASKKKKTDVPNTTANTSLNVSSTETNNTSSTTPKQKKKK